MYKTLGTPLPDFPLRMSVSIVVAAVLIVPNMRSFFLAGTFWSSIVVARSEATFPLASICNSSLPKIVCIDKYASVIPYPFFRAVSNGTSNPDFKSTSVPNDPSFAELGTAHFLVFDRARGLELLGSNPTYD